MIPITIRRCSRYSSSFSTCVQSIVNCLSTPTHSGKMLECAHLNITKTFRSLTAGSVTSRAPQKAIQTSTRPLQEPQGQSSPIFVIAAIHDTLTAWHAGGLACLTALPPMCYQHMDDDITAHVLADRRFISALTHELAGIVCQNDCERATSSGRACKAQIARFCQMLTLSLVWGA